MLDPALVREIVVDLCTLLRTSCGRPCSFAHHPLCPNLFGQRFAPHTHNPKQLLRKGADVSRRDPASHQSSLDLAVSGTACCPSNRSRIVKTLLASKADPNGGGGGSVLGHSTPLHTACRVGGTVGVDVVEALLEGGADPDAPPPGEGGRRLLRPLHIAAVHGNADAVSALTLRGCWLDVKTLDPSRWVVICLLGRSPIPFTIDASCNRVRLLSRLGFFVGFAAYSFVRRVV